jgi:hypothetical protein
MMVWGKILETGHLCFFMRTLMMVWGKILETVGAFLLAWVALRAFLLAALIDLPGTEPRNPALQRVMSRLEKTVARRKEQFGFIEAFLVSVGASLIAIGCSLYLAGLLKEH